MKRLLLSLLVLVCFCIPALAQKVRVFGIAGQTQNIRTQGSSTTPVLRTFPSCTITVYATGTVTPVSLWTASDGLTPLANPFTANSDATYGFFVTSGTVLDIRFSGGSITTPFTITAVSSPGTGGGGGGGSGDALTSNPLSQFAATTSDQLRGVITNPTGTGPLVFATAPNITAPTGIVKADVGLSNVDNTSDSTKNTAIAAFTNKTIDGDLNTVIDLPANTVFKTGTLVPITNIATGTPTGAKFIRDDGTLQLIPGGGDALTANPLSQFAATTSAQFFGVISNETGGTGVVVGSISPALTGIPTAPTAAAATNTTQIATTAHVFAERTNTKTLTNTTLTSPVITTPTGIVKGDVGLGNVDNTSDANKPVSTATSTALALKANLASPTFTGTPTLPTGTIAVTQSAGNSTTAVATTAFVTTADNLKANIASPTFTGTVGLPANTVLTTPALTLRTQANNTAIVANSFYRNTTDFKLYIGAYDGAANHEIFEAGVSGPVSTSNGGTGSTLGADVLLSSTAGVDLNTATATTLFTCPASSTCAITKVLITAASTSLTTASISFGWNSASFNDVIANATHTELTGSTLYTVLNAKVGAKLGAAADTFKVLANTLQGGAATVTIKVFGIVY